MLYLVKIKDNIQFAPKCWVLAFWRDKFNLLRCPGMGLRQAADYLIIIFLTLLPRRTMTMPLAVSGLILRPSSE